MNKVEFENKASWLRATALHTAKYCGVDGIAAEDVAQDAMLKLWAIHDQLVDEGKLKSYAIIVTRHIISEYRKKEFLKSTIESAAAMISSEEANAETIDKDNEQWLRDKLSRVAITERQVITMHHVEEYAPSICLPCLSRTPHIL